MFNINTQNKSSKEFFNIVESVCEIPGHIYCKDINGVYLWCNKEQLATLGLPDLSQILGKTDFDICDHATASRIRQVDLRIINSGKAEIVEEEGVFGDVKVTLSYKAPLKNSRGETIGIIGNSINAGAQTATRKHLINENRNKTIALENVVANLPGYTYWKDLKGEILGCNDKQAQIFNLKKASDIIGKTVFDLVAQDVAEKVHKNDMHIIQSGKTEIIEEDVIVRGKRHIFISHKSPLKDPQTGEVVGILGVSIDVTRQKELEEAYSTQNLELAQALEVKRHFLNNMSHEVRTPLTSFISMTEAMEDSWDRLTEEKKKSCVKDILDGRDRLMSLLSNLLDLSEFQKSKATFEFAFHDLKFMVIEVVDEFKDISHPIDLHLASNVDTYVSCDAWRLKQVLRNLIANSVKHGGENKTIAITISEEGKNYVKISISDEGVGIPEGELESIFEPFVESQRTKRLSGGTGMGLALCKNIITGHNGKIWAENNNSGTGSTFHFTLPYEKQSPKVYTFRLTRKS